VFGTVRHADGCDTLPRITLPRITSDVISREGVAPARRADTRHRVHCRTAPSENRTRSSTRIVGVIAYLRTMRGASLVVAGHVYHLISRFVARHWFIKCEEERRTYLSLLGRALVLSDWRCFAFAVMSSHIHLAVVAGKTPLTAWMATPHAQFARWQNERQPGRIGAVFVRGPDVTELWSIGAGVLVNYIHNNPVRARVVEHPADSDWTSYQAYAGAAKRPAWLDIETGSSLAGFRNVDTFRAWCDRSPRSTRAEVEAFRPKLQTPGRPRRIDHDIVW